MTQEKSNYPQSQMEKEYSENSFWDKVKTTAKLAGKEVIEKAFTLFYYAKDTNTPAKDKIIVFGALGYFILPIDAIPDVIAVLGFTDDLGVLIAAYNAIAKNITDEHMLKAKVQTEKLFV